MPQSCPATPPPIQRILGVVVLLAMLSIAAANAAQPAVRASPLTAIEAARAAVEDATLEDTERQFALAQIDAAENRTREADDLQVRLGTLRAEVADHPARMERLRQALALDRDQALADWAERLPQDADAETLERVLEQERSIISGLGTQIDAVGAELAQALSGPVQVAGEVAALRQRLEELSAPVAVPEEEPPAVTDARRLRRATELRRVQAELELRLAQQESAMQRQRLQELTLRELRFRQGLHGRRAELLQARIADLGRRDLEQLAARLAAQEQAHADADPALQAAAADNRQIGDELVAQNEQLARDRDALAAHEQARDRIVATLRDSRTRVELGGATDRVGRWLWTERRRLETPARIDQRLESVRRTLVDLRLRVVLLGEQQQELADPRAAARALVESSALDIDDKADELGPAQALEPLLAERTELITVLESLLERRIAALERSEHALTAQSDHSRALQQLLDRHLLWTPSHAPLHADWFQQIPIGLVDLVKPSRFATTLRLSGRALQERPLPWVVSLLLLIVLIELRRRAPKAIEAQASVTRQVRRDTYRATAIALGWTILAALPGPAAAWLAGELLQTIGTPGRYSHSLGQALTMLALPLFAVQFLTWSAMERGLGHAHFRWLQARRATLRRVLPRAAAIILPMYFISSLAFIRNLDLPNDVQARIAIVVACVTLAWTVWHVLDEGRLWVIRGVVSEPSALRKSLRVFLPIAPLGVAVLALTGFVYSAGVLLQLLLASFGVMVAIATVVGLLARWFLLGERRLAWRRMEEQRAALAQAPEEQAESGAVPTPEAEVTLEQVNAQTGRLLRALRLVLLALGLIWVWADVLPAFARLDEITLWYFSETGPDGGKLQLPVTLMAVLLGVLALALTGVAARNLPGLIEIGLLSRTHIDAASRYAVTSILRYAIVITGILIGLNLLGMRWSQLQWLAAALTVGLGFGLQEIFANFVSGLILLFERPFRVGDVITVGELSGSVTRIRTRATTIVDFDNKEIVVPNKNFITGQLINWTLTDATTRVTIKVGVAYGTDANKVHELLLQAARENPLVLVEPEPKSWFLTFGGSALDFELRVFVAALADRLPVQNALNTRIASLFDMHGIEIAFPQLDVHVRDLPSAASEQAVKRRRSP